MNPETPDMPKEVAPDSLAGEPSLPKKNPPGTKASLGSDDGLAITSTPVGSDPVNSSFCKRCASPLRSTARFCSACGSDQSVNPIARKRGQGVRQPSRDWVIIREVVCFYFVYLVTVVPLTWAPASAIATSMMLVGIIDAILIMVYWRYTRTSLVAALQPRINLIGPTVLGCGLLVVLLPLNTGYHELLRWLFSLGPQSSGLTAPFTTEGYGLTFQLITLALFPAIWEEIAFRGLIQKRLSEVVSTHEAIWLTAVLFAVIHVDWLSLPYFFLIGIVLGVLRHRSGSLLPGIALHCFHNAAVVLLD